MLHGKSTFLRLPTPPAAKRNNPSYTLHHRKAAAAPMHVPYRKVPHASLYSVLLCSVLSSPPATSFNPCISPLLA